MDSSFPPLLPLGFWQDRVAFEVRDRSRTFMDVVRSAAIRGDLAPLLARSERIRQCEFHASREGLDPDMDAVDSSLEEFRYARDLVTIEETERWLEERGLSVDDLTGHFLRRHWFNLLRGTAPSETMESTGDEPPTWPTDLMCFGDFTRFARQLAAESASAADHPVPGPTEAAVMIEGFQARHALTGPAYAAWLAASEMDEAQLVEFLHGQEREAMDRRQRLSDEARGRALTELRSQLVQAELEWVEFDRECAAREAYLCATTDRIELAQIAQDSGYALRCRTSFLRDLPESWQWAILSVPPGRILAPLAGAETVSVVRLIGRREPTLTDPAIAAEIDQVLLQRHFGERELREIRWQLSGGNAP